MDDAFIHDLSVRFQAMMESRSKNLTTNTSDPGAASGNTTISMSTAYLSDPGYRKLLSLSRHPTHYMKAGLIDKALDAIDLGLIYAWADVEAEQDPSLGYQDHVIKSLLKWFKEQFFEWVNSPVCSLCGAETEGIGASRPSSTEMNQGADRTEIYRCKHNSQHLERFPRYNDVETLLTSRKGRCGEFANCFTLLCIALGSRARWVYNFEDHVWTEVYSNTLKRWVHCDVCENSWDSPQIYAVGWGKKMSQCIGFSVSGAQDVTRRYVRSEAQSLPRTIPDNIMNAAIQTINNEFRKAMTSSERNECSEENLREAEELAAYLRDSETPVHDEARPRQSGTVEWKQQRGENGDM